MERGPQTDSQIPPAEVPVTLTPEEIEQQKKTITDELHEQLGIKLPKIENNISFVDVTRLAESEARDTAEERLTEGKEKVKGIRNIFKRVWKYNLAREYYRQKEIAQVRDEIYSEKNLYAGTGDKKNHHKEAMGAITERFLSEYDVVRKEAGEERVGLDGIENVSEEEKAGLGEAIKQMVIEYASGESANEAAFEAARDRILNKVTELGKGVVDGGKMYADNLKQIADQVRMAVKQGHAIDQLDLNFDVSIGRATSGVHTENSNKVDGLIEKSKKYTGMLVNETTVASAIAIAASVAPKVGLGITRHAAKAVGFFGGLGATAAIAGAKENSRLKQERRQHARGMAKGMEIGNDSPRRDNMEEYRYETIPAEELRNELLSHIYIEGNPEKGTVAMEPGKFDDVVGMIAQIEGRINLSNKRKIDLISYSDVTKVEVERTRLEIDLARAKVALRKMLDADPTLKGDVGDFNTSFSDKVGAFENQTMIGELRDKDRAFNKMKRAKVAYAAMRGAFRGALIGVGVQEIASAFDPSVEGLLSHGSHTEHNTTLEQLRENIFGRPNGQVVHLDKHLVDMNWHDANEHVQFPEGTKLIENGDGTVNITAPDGTVSEHIPFQFDGTQPSAETLKALEDHHIAFLDGFKHSIDGGQTASIETTPDQYVASHGENLHAIKRDLWYDNNTEKPIFDKNELGTHWGGVGGTGIDEQGNYVFNIEHMSEDGSYHGEFSADAKELMKNGGLKMLFSISHDTQHQVFEVPIDEHGNALIDPNSEAGKLLFKTVDGKAVFMGKFAEVGQVMPGADAEHFRILSTVEGQGVDTIPDTTPVTDEVTRLRFGFEEAQPPRDWDLPPVIPVMGRKPLEPLGRPEPEEQKPVQEPRVVRPVVASPFAEKPVDAVPVVETPKEPVVGKVPEQPAKDVEIPNEGFGTTQPEQKKTLEQNAISQEEYDALRDDINLINKKVQGNEGIITVDENSFQSEYAKKRYKELKNIKPGIPVQFNRTELRTMGDEIDNLLMKSKIDRSLDKLMLTPEEYEDLVDDIKFINKKVQANEGIITVNEGDLLSAFGKRKYNELKNIKPGIPVQFNRTELREIGDLMENNILAGSKVARTARDIELMRRQRGTTLGEVPVREKKLEAPQSQPVTAPEIVVQQPTQPKPTIETPVAAKPTIETPKENPVIVDYVKQGGWSGEKAPEQPKQLTMEDIEQLGAEKEIKPVVPEKEDEKPAETPVPEQKAEKKDEGMVYQEYPKKYTVGENFLGVANAKETTKLSEAILTFDPQTRRVLPYKEGWEALLQSTKGDPFFLERALKPFFNYELKGKDFGTNFEKIRFIPAEIDPANGMVVKKGEIKVVDDGSPLIK